MIVRQRSQWAFLVLAFLLARATLFSESKPENSRDPEGALSGESFVTWSTVAWLVSDYYVVHHTWPSSVPELRAYSRQVATRQPPIAGEHSPGNIDELFGRLSHLELEVWQENDLIVTVRFHADAKPNGVAGIFHPGNTTDEILQAITFTIEAEGSVTDQEEHPAPSGRVLEFGLYQQLGEDRGTPHIVPEATAQRVWEDGNPLKLIAKTDQIPAVLGAGFFFISEITGLPEGSTDVQWVVKHPEIRKPDGTTSIGYSYTRSLDTFDGRCLTQQGYFLDHNYEIAEGTWSFAFVYQGKTLVEQTFTLRKP
jgi:Domain of unknown function (DUF3859)